MKDFQPDGTRLIVDILRECRCLSREQILLYTYREFNSRYKGKYKKEKANGLINKLISEKQIYEPEEGYIAITPTDRPNSKTIIAFWIFLSIYDFTYNNLDAKNKVDSVIKPYIFKQGKYPVDFLFYDMYKAKRILFYTDERTDGVKFTLFNESKNNNTNIDTIVVLINGESSIFKKIYEPKTPYQIALIDKNKTLPDCTCPLIKLSEVINNEQKVEG